VRLLLVEDEPDAARLLAKGLREEAYAVDVAATGPEAAYQASINDYDAIILDLMLPGRDGLSVCRELRERGSVIPILMLTARDGIEARIDGLDSGADDYLVKPFDLDELSARIGSVARRYAGNPNPIITHGPLEIDLASRSVHRNGRPVQLTAREWALFEAFLTRPGQLLSRAQLEDKLYAFGAEVESNAIEVHVSRLRKKLGAGVIETERGLGYRLGRP